MTTLLLHHDDCLRHDPGPHHPERPERLSAVLTAVRGLPGVEPLPAPKASTEMILRVHDPAYWELLVDSEPADRERVALDPDTFLSCGSIDAALRAAGAACFAWDQITAGKARNAFCAVRPPGHHAGVDFAMGFCLVNNAAVLARHALAGNDTERVAIIDFDVHHGNGTQAIFEQSPEVLYVSSHQSPLYPGSGGADETGCGNIVNLPLAPGSDGAAFRAAWSQRGLPAVAAFEPQLIVVSAGFDGHERDPLAQLQLVDEDFGWVTTEICRVAAECCDGRVISLLEGGYDLDALASASAAHVTALAS